MQFKTEILSVIVCNLCYLVIFVANFNTSLFSHRPKKDCIIASEYEPIY